MHEKYGDQLGKSTDELFNLMESNFTKAIEHNADDYLSHYTLGYIDLNKKKYKEAIPFFLRSIELNKDFVSSYYNLAYAYLYTDDRINALKYAKISLGLYNDSTYKGDAARMIAVIYSELKDEKNAIEYYTLSDKIDPNNYYTLKSLLSLYIRTDNASSKQMLGRFFDLDPESPTIYNDLADIYFTNKKTDQLLAFYLSKIPGKNSKITSGNLLFYTGEIYLDSNKTIAKEYFQKAKTTFATAYDSNNPVFKAIDNAIEKTN